MGPEESAIPADPSSPDSVRGSPKPLPVVPAGGSRMTVPPR
jgi:hypothetical protein